MINVTSLNLQEALSIGQHVLREEASGLMTLADCIGPDFGQAVEIIANSSGRVGVTGIGKSGHVCRKIAATLNSTGTPSYFIHPSEASHGDLGCVRNEDVLLALSNSGESYELSDVLAYAARRAIPVIAVTKNRHSFLGRQAEVVIPLPDVGEAGPLGCAPTTSTTMSMALGDALAMALLQLRGFTAEEFAHFHPGGQLGRKLMLVEDIMHKGEDLPLADTSMLMSEALCIMTGKGFGCVAVQKNGTLLGVVSDGDLRRHMSDDLLHKTVEEVMTPNPVTITPSSPAAKALGIMNKRLITTLMVVDEENTIMGLIHLHDCLRAGLE